MPSIICPFSNSTVKCKNQVNQYCHDCNMIICSECHIIPGHKVISIYVSTCYKLNHTADYYCLHCSKTYCSGCVTVHSGHKIIKI